MHWDSRLRAAQAWGSIMRRYENALLHFRHPRQNHHHFHVHPFAMAARVDPTVMIGGTLPILGTGHRVGKGKTIILESCEYCNPSCPSIPPLAVILNIEADHLDFFKDLEDVEHAFRAFADFPAGGNGAGQRGGCQYHEKLWRARRGCSPSA